MFVCIYIFIFCISGSEDAAAGSKEAPGIDKVAGSDETSGKEEFAGSEKAAGTVELRKLLELVLNSIEFF